MNQSVQTANSVGRISFKKMGQLLIEAGLVTKDQIEKAIRHQGKAKRKKLEELLIDSGYITESQFLMVLAESFQRKFVDLSKVTPDHKALAAIPKDIAYEFKAFPVEDQGTTLVVAVSDPAALETEQLLQSRIDRPISCVLATSSQISDALDACYLGKRMTQITDLIETMREDADREDEQTKESLDAISESDSRIISLVNKMLADAYAKRASDIHFDPGPRGIPFEIRFRIDGVCSLAYSLPETSKRAVTSRIKIMSNLDIAERRKPQSGKFMLSIQDEKVEFRVEVTPTVDDNENVVLRLLSRSSAVSLDQLGFSPFNLHAFQEMIVKPYGIVLSVGPTGSGKTTTLHSALAHINKPDITIWTAENPVEIRQPGLKQVQVNPRIGYTFSEALRSFLRADPDVIMIGEMRDVETAKIAFEASLTGHLVFSTLHTNGAAETVVRLMEMGIPHYHFADALLGIVAQRLARKLCGKCKQPYHPDRQEYDGLIEYYDAKWAQEHAVPEYSPDLTFWAGKGCSFCGGKGYYGRIAIHEVIEATSSVKKAIRDDVNVEELKSVALKGGMRTLRMDGVMKIMQGITDYEQVRRVCL